MIEIENLTHLFDKKTASQQFEPACGAGRSLRLSRTEWGGEKHDGQDSDGNDSPPHRAARASAAWMSKSSPWKSNGGSVTSRNREPCTRTCRRASTLDLVASLHHLDPKQAGTRSDELLDIFDMLPEKNNRMTQFSKGMKQKVLLTSALLTKPDVLFLDEPLNGSRRQRRRPPSRNSSNIWPPRARRFSSALISWKWSSATCTRIAIVDKGIKTAEGTVPDILASTECGSLEDAFRKLTGVREVGEVTADFLSALERV